MQYRGGMFLPSDIAAQQSRVNDFINRMAEDAASQEFPEQYRKGLGQFVTEWNAWLAENSSWAKRALNSTAATLDLFEERARDWYKTLKGLNVKVYTPLLPGFDFNVVTPPWGMVALGVGAFFFGVVLYQGWKKKAPNRVAFTVNGRRKRR